MKLNNKGVTLIELIISIVLITIIMGFMFKLILDVTNKENNDTYASKNQLKRNEIIKTIENDFLNNEIISFSESGDSNERNLFFEFNNGSDSILTLTKNTIKYETNTSGATQTNTWTMEDCEIDISNVNITEKYSDNLYLILIDIEIFTNNDENNNCEGCKNNIIDDIILSNLSISSSVGIEL